MEKDLTGKEFGALMLDTNSMTLLDMVGIPTFVI